METRLILKEYKYYEECDCITETPEEERVYQLIKMKELVKKYGVSHKENMLQAINGLKLRNNKEYHFKLNKILEELKNKKLDYFKKV